MNKKQCGTCLNIYPVTPDFFSRERSRPDGFRTQCKACEHARKKVYRETHTELIYEQKKRDREKHKEQVAARKQQYQQGEVHKAYQKRYQQEHKEEIALQNKQYYQSHKKEACERQRQHRKANPEHYYSIDKAHKSERRAQKLAAGGSHTSQQLKDQMRRQRGKCYYCKQDLSHVYHVDHIVPLAKGGSNDIHNIVLACGPCNLQKHARLPHEWPEGGRLL